MRHLLAAGLAMVLAGSAAHAGQVSFVSDNANSSNGATSEGKFSGTLDLTGNLLTLMITNSGGLGNGGFITGIAFNFANGAAASFNSGLSNAAAQAFVELDAPVDANPFGSFEYGLALDTQNPSWLGGGSPNSGIADGETGTFVFNVTDSDLSTPLNVMDFLTETPQGEQFAFVVRLRGIDDGGGSGSDKLPIIVRNPPVAVPLPPAAWAGLATLAPMALGIARRRNKR